MKELGRLLLYSNSVAIDDPIWWLVCDMIGQHDRNEQWILETWDRQTLRDERPQILEGLRFLAEYRPLIENNRLVLVPNVFHIHRGGLTYEVTEANADVVTPLDLELAKGPEGPWDWGARTRARRGFDSEEWRQYYQSEEWRRHAKKALLEDAMSEMDARLRSICYFGGAERLDIATDFPVHQQALNKLLGEVIDLTDVLRLQTLATLPGLRIEADPKRLVSLALDDETFGDWRRGVAKALDRVAGIDRTQPNYEALMHRAFQEELGAVVSEQRRRREGRGWRGVIAPRIEDIAFGGIGTAALWTFAATVGSPFTPAAAIPVVVSAAARTIWTYAQGWGARQQAKVIKELYDELGGDDSSIQAIDRWSAT